MILLRHSYILVLLIILKSTTTYSQTARLVGTGTLDGGTIYSINVDGNSPETFFDMRFGKNDYWQQPLLIEKNGKLYGVTTQGVSSRYGVIFRIDPDGLNYTEIFQFNGTNGHQPNASLIDINGKFYGTTWSGGSSNVGLIFSIDYDGFGFEIIHEFQAGSDDGEKPIGDLLEYNGALWGVTAGGGIDDSGTLFTVKLLDDSYTKIHDFDRELANNPSGSLIEIAGDLWGMSFWGGENSSGVIYKISLADTTYSNIHSFSSGSGPLGSLLWENDYIWGTSRKGGSIGGGYLFRIKSDGTLFEIVHDHVTDRLSPEGGLLVNNGKIWGLANDFSGDIQGGIYSIDVDGTNHTMHHIFSFNTNYLSGVNPSGTLLDYDGKFYGVTFNGGSGGTGVIFKISNEGTGYEVINEFDKSDGYAPIGNLVEGEDKIFGIASEGGKGFGVIFSINKDGSNYTKIHEFDQNNYHNPREGLVIYENELYGSTAFGGTYGYGGIFKIKTDGLDYTEIRDFQSSEINARITTLLGNKLWGNHSGIFFKGAVFSVNLDGSDFQNIFDFNGTNGDLIVGKYLHFNNKLWGVTRYGGENNLGVIFSIDPAGNNFDIVHHFDGINGSNPSDALVLFGEELWGTTYRGGAENRGTVYRIDDEGIYEVVYSFSNEVGVWPQAALVENYGTLYGTTRSSGGGSGSLYKIDPETLNFTKITAFSSEFGGRPSITPIIIKDYQDITFDAIEAKIYGDDSFTLSATSNSVNPITFSSSDESIISITGDQATIEGAGEVTLYATQLEYENYHAGQAEQTIIIDKAQISAKATDKEMAYGADLPELDINYTGFVNGDTELDITEPDISTLATSTSDVNDYEITLSGGFTTNYELFLNPGTLTIMKATLEISANNKEVTYGDNIPVLDMSYDGFLNSDTEQDITVPSISTMASSLSDAGNYEIALSGGSAANYELILNPGTLTIGKAILEVVANNKEMVYGDDLPELDIAYAGFLNDDTEQDITVPSISTMASSLSDAGNYEIALSEGSAANYELILNPGTLTIGKAILEVVANNKEMVYGDDLPELDITYIGFLNDDSELDTTEPSISTMASSLSDAGNYEIALSGGSAANYELILNPGTLTIGKASLEAVANNKEMVYGDDLPELDITYIGFFNDDSELDITEPSISTMASSQSSAGNYEIALSGGSAANYELILNPGTLTIGKASLEAVANNKEMVYGDDLPELDITYIGFLNDDSELDITEPSISTIASSQSSAGNYEIALSGGSAANYELSLNPGTLSIKKAPQSIEFEALSTISTEQNEIVLSAESSSGLVVIFESTDESVLSIDGNLGTIVGAGIVEIIAKQPGNNNYLEAEPVSRVLTIEQVLGLDIAFELNVYPNPFNDYFIVKSSVNSGTIEGLIIFNSKGVSIPFELIDQGTQLMIKPKQLEPGLYFTQFKVDGKTYNQRLIFK